MFFFLTSFQRCLNECDLCLQNYLLASSDNSAPEDDSVWQTLAELWTLMWIIKCCCTLDYICWLHSSDVWRFGSLQVTMARDHSSWMYRCADSDEGQLESLWMKFRYLAFTFSLLNFWECFCICIFCSLLLCCDISPSKNKGLIVLKLIVHPKNESHNLITLKLFQTCMSFFQLLITKEDISKNVGTQTDAGSHWL